MTATTGFWAHRAEQESLGKANGMQPFTTKAFYAGVGFFSFFLFVVGSFRLLRPIVLLSDWIHHGSYKLKIFGNGFVHDVYIQVTGLVAGVGYGTFYWAYYPDKFAFGHKNLVTAGPSRGMLWMQHTMLRPTVMFSVVGLTFAGVESLMEELRGSHHKEPINSAYAGAAAGVVLGGFMTKRFDIATMTGLGMGMLMGLLELNGSSVVCDPKGEAARKFPVSMPAQFQETTTLNDLKEKYPAYKSN